MEDRAVRNPIKPTHLDPVSDAIWLMERTRVLLQNLEPTVFGSATARHEHFMFILKEHDRVISKLVSASL